MTPTWHRFVTTPPCGSLRLRVHVHQGDAWPHTTDAHAGPTGEFWTVSHAVQFVRGPCYCCAEPFNFDADRVSSVEVDPVTDRPPKLAAVHDGGFEFEPPDPDAARRAIRRPVCPTCCQLVNDQRRAAGLPLLPEVDSLAVS